MSELKFRDLKADEIDVRISQITDKGLSLLLYKDARCDMNILDETVGAFNWQRTHTRDNANCVVSIWDETKSVWVSKEDTGTESNTEKEKGLASDSFKRACFNWGIGRELYTAPFIWIGADKCEITKRNDGKFVCYDKFYVQDIKIKDKKITGLAIGIVKGKKTVFSTTKPKKEESSKTEPVKAEPVPAPEQKTTRDILRELCKKNGIDTHMVIQVCGLNPNSTDEDYLNAIAYVKQNLGA
jgi:hypothetical protein